MQPDLGWTKSPSRRIACQSHAHHPNQAALTELINQKRNGKPIAAKARPKGENVVDLMDALKRSIANDRGAEPAKGKKPRKAAAGQKEMLLPISRKRAAKAEARGLESPEMSMTGGYRNETKK